MRPLIAGILSIAATIPAYVIGRLIAYYFQGARGGNFVAQFFWEFTAGGFAAAGALIPIAFLMEGHPAEKTTQLVVAVIVSTLLIALAVAGLLVGHEYKGSQWEAAGGLIGLPAGFLIISLVIRNQ